MVPLKITENAITKVIPVKKSSIGGNQYLDYL